INDHGVEGIWLYRLGESFLHPDFRKIVRSLEKLDNIGLIWTSTNGHLFSQSNLDFIMDSRIDFLNYSLNAMTAETYKAMTPLGNFDLVQKNYRRLVDYKADKRGQHPLVRVQIVEHELNKNEPSDFIKTHYPEVEVVSVSMLDYVNLPANSYGLVQRQRTNPGRCSKVSRGDCFVCSNGVITPCDPSYNCDEKEAGPLLFGNIYESSLHDIWNGEKRKKVLELNQAGRLTDIELCRNCQDYDL
ncbi:MAG: SPASM domain-containing protein, partial [Deltaproteobacteria bacterium]|nr:SPASM domain-containing protein [Deltaproteobacteria bacterium]